MIVVKKLWKKQTKLKQFTCSKSTAEAPEALGAKYAQS